ncbi:hypothetical protein HMPREF1548_04350 [Clostridium sp. KLE 1755]|nr:hypothetical protein HMPREF1548_04350 [Clostridium sp. KLE 1755]
MEKGNSYVSAAIFQKYNICLEKSYWLFYSLWYTYFTVIIIKRVIDL